MTFFLGFRHFYSWEFYLLFFLLEKEWIRKDKAGQLCNVLCFKFEVFFFFWPPPQCMGCCQSLIVLCVMCTNVTASWQRDITWHVICSWWLMSNEQEWPRTIGSQSRYQDKTIISLSSITFTVDLLSVELINMTLTQNSEENHKLLYI